MELMSQMLSSEGANAGLAWMFCIAGGALVASYPVFIKVPRVVAAQVSPFIFQSYKSFWVFVLAWIFLLVNYLRAMPLFIFTWWGVASAALWVPAGFCAIAAVSMCGVATTAVFDSAVSSFVQFLVSLMLDEKMKRHGESNVPYAPFYLLAVVLGMVGLILSTRVSLGTKADAAIKLNSNAVTASTVSVSIGLEDGSVLLPAETKSDLARREYVVGVLLAMLCGVLSASKFAVKHIGHHLAVKSGADNVDAKFGIFESFTISFGIGCAIVTPLYLAIFGLWQKGIQHKELPSLEFPVMKIFGFLAGLTWFAAYICQQAANDLGGQATFGPSANAIKLVVAGLWGLLYFREITGPVKVTCWVLSATWTIAFIILLAGELEKKE